MLGPETAKGISSGASPLVSSSEFNRSVGHQIKMFSSLTPGPQLTTAGGGVSTTHSKQASHLLATGTLPS